MSNLQLLNCLCMLDDCYLKSVFYVIDDVGPFRRYAILYCFEVYLFNSSYSTLRKNKTINSSLAAVQYDYTLTYPTLRRRRSRIYLELCKTGPR